MKKMIPDIPEEVHEAFYAAERSAKFPLAVNDVMMVLKGRKSGEKAAVISIQSIAPSVTYLVEYGDGSNDLVALENLCANECPDLLQGPTSTRFV